MRRRAPRGARGLKPYTRFGLLGRMRLLGDFPNARGLKTLFKK